MGPTMAPTKKPAKTMGDAPVAAGDPEPDADDDGRSAEEAGDESRVRSREGSVGYGAIDEDADERADDADDEDADE